MVRNIYLTDEETKVLDNFRKEIKYWIKDRSDW